MLAFLRKKTEFEVVDEQRQLEIVHVYVEQFEVSGPNGRRIVEGQRSFRTTGGEEVDLVSQTRFRVRATGRLLHCDPPGYSLDPPPVV